MRDKEEGLVLVIMKEQARMTNNGSPGLWSRQRQCCSNYSANTAALWVYVCVCVRVTCGSGAEGIALLAAVSQEAEYCKRRMCVCGAFRMIHTRDGEQGKTDQQFLCLFSQEKLIFLSDKLKDTSRDVLCFCYCI